MAPKHTSSNYVLQLTYWGSRVGEKRKQERKRKGESKKERERKSKREKQKKETK